jgi:hypothetical protein
MKLFLRLILFSNLLSIQLSLSSMQIGSSLDLFNYQDTPVQFSILIATIEKRQALFNKLYQKLVAQLKTYGLETAVEILFFKDDQTHTVGYKRNYLVAQAKGEYVCFVDDDDDISEYYVKLIYDACKTKPDCISCTGVFYMPNKRPKIFKHSLKYHKIFIDHNGFSCSPVYHINPVRRALALQVLFPEQNRKEDDVWSEKMQALGLLKTEVEINVPYYFYHYNPNK